jgi:hypothetical protein
MAVMASLRHRLVALGSPVVTGSVLVLVVNDHVLKERFPGWLTGKLSDFAGVALVALLVGLVSGRPRLSVMSTAVAFAALKTVPGVAELAAPILGGLTRRDPMDVMAIAVLPFVLNWLTRRVERQSLSAQKVLSLTTLVLSVFAIGATMCDGPSGVQSFTVRGSSVWTPVSKENETDSGWVRSDDGGATFVAAEAPPGQSVEPPPLFNTACLSNGVCIRGLENDVMEERQPNGRWVPAYGFDRKNRRAIGLDRVQCYPIFVRPVVVRTALGESVLVPMGYQGAFVRDPAGRWRQQAIGRDIPTVKATAVNPARLPRIPRWKSLVELSPPLLALGSLVIFFVLRIRAQRPRVVFLLASVVGAVATASVLLAGQYRGDGVKNLDDVPLRLPALALTVFLVSIGYATYEHRAAKRDRHAREAELDLL